MPISLRLDRLERETGIEPATFSLARRCSTTEPLPQFSISNESTPFPFTTEPLPTIVRSLVIKWAVRDSNSHGSSPTDPKSALSTNFSNRPSLLNGKEIKLPLVDDTSATRLLSRHILSITIWAIVLCTSEPN